MCEAVTRAMERHAVSEPFTISLWWSGYLDDLDLHVVTPSGDRVFYANKKAGGCLLDFDVIPTSQDVIDAVENVSVLEPNSEGKSYRIYVNNFNNCSGDDVPFKVVIRALGEPDVVHEYVWCKSRGRNGQNDLSRMMFVCEHAFSRCEAAPVVRRPP